MHHFCTTPGYRQALQDCALTITGEKLEPLPKVLALHPMPWMRRIGTGYSTFVKKYQGCSFRIDVSERIVFPIKSLFTPLTGVKENLPLGPPAIEIHEVTNPGPPEENFLPNLNPRCPQCGTAIHWRTHLS
jgi:hypothetical protein